MFATVAWCKIVRFAGKVLQARWTGFVWDYFLVLIEEYICINLLLFMILLSSTSHYTTVENEWEVEQKLSLFSDVTFTDVQLLESVKEIQLSVRQYNHFVYIHDNNRVL